MIKHLFRHILTLTLAAMTIVSCSDDTPAPAPAATDAEVFFSIDMSLPAADNGSRSSTTDNGGSTDGTQAATAEECAVKSMLLIFTDPVDQTLLYTLIGEKSITRDNNDPSHLIASTSLKLSTVSEAIAGKYLNLYVLANPLPGPYGTLVNKSFSPLTASYPISSLGDVQLSTLDALPMSNAEKYMISPIKATDLESHLSSATPLNLNVYSNYMPLMLERSVARVDYKDGSTGSDRTYPLGKSGYSVKLESMQPINVSKSIYCMRHTSIDGSVARTVLFGRETPKSGYVIDTDADMKRSLTAPAADHFINPGGSYSASLATPAGSLGDDLDGKGYRFWIYLSENTLPSVESQQQRYSTGVIFHTRITAAPEGVDLSGTSPITINYRGDEVTVPYSAATAGNPAGYYLDYYYFIQHNDNSIDGMMGVMEYGVVRNNIYRLSLLSIDGLPRPYDPEGPDEDDRITLQVRVRKWGYHKIEFDM